MNEMRIVDKFKKENDGIDNERMDIRKGKRGVCGKLKRSKLS